MKKKSQYVGPTIVTDAKIDKDGSFGAALGLVLRKARGTGKVGWKNFIDAASRMNFTLSNRPGSKATKIMRDVWGVATAESTARNKISRLHEIRNRISRIKVDRQ